MQSWNNAPKDELEVDVNNTTQALELFALTNIPGMRVMRMPLTHDVQIGISELFRSQEQEFLLGIEEEIRFDGLYRPEENELLYIDRFDDVDGIKAAIQRPHNCPEFVFQNGSIESIKAIFTGYVKNGMTRVLLQGFDRRRIISAKGFSIVHSGNVFTKFDGSGLTLDNKLTALIDGDRLKFASYHFLRQIFDMSAYCKEATEQDLKVFLQHAKLQFADPHAFVDAADAWVRRKIILIQQSGILDHCSVIQLAAAAKHFDLNLQLSGQQGQERIVFPAERNAIKQILRFLDEDYFQAPASATKYMANMKRVMDRY